MKEEEMEDDLFLVDDDNEEIEAEQESDETPEPELSEDEIIEKSFNESISQALNPKEELDEPIEPEPQKIAGMTEAEIKEVFEKVKQYDELQAKLKKTNDTVFGKLGSLEQTLKSLTQSGGTGKKVSKETFKKLSEFFDDEQIAEALAEDLADISFGGQSFDPTELTNSFNERLEKTKQDFELKLLEMAHPKWRDDHFSDEFATWKTKLKPEAQAIIDQSNDGLQLAKVFSQFKEFKQKKAEKELSKQQRLESNVHPTKGAAASQQNTNKDTEYYFNQRLKEVLKNR